MDLAVLPARSMAGSGVSAKRTEKKKREKIGAQTKTRDGTKTIRKRALKSHYRPSTEPSDEIEFPSSEGLEAQDLSSRGLAISGPSAASLGGETPPPPWPTEAEAEVVVEEDPPTSLPWDRESALLKGAAAAVCGATGSTLSGTAIPRT